jgi:mRNA-degrading endonuclease toxin of MazEF toxin-antitoxin module
MEFKRGQIYRFNLEPARGSEQQGIARPCVVLSLTPFNKQFRTIGIVPLSSSAKVYEPVSIAMPSAGDTSVALVYRYRTADKTRAGKYVGEISAPDMARLEGALRQYLGL